MYFLLGVLCFYCHCLVWYCTFVQNYFPFRQITWMCWWKDKWNKFWYLVMYCIPQADRKLRLDFKANKMGPTHSWWVIFLIQSVQRNITQTYDPNLKTSLWYTSLKTKPQKKKLQPSTTNNVKMKNPITSWRIIDHHPISTVSYFCTFSIH